VSTPQPHCGIIGLGLVGAALAERLLSAGCRVTGYDIRAEQTEALRLMGGEPVSSSAEAARRSAHLMLSLPTSAVVAGVLNEISPQLQPGAIVIDTTTGAPEDGALFAARLGALGVDYVDATVGGSSRQVRQGEAIFICGGTEEAFHRCRDLLSLCSRQVFHVGPPGSGAAMKLVLNLVLGLNRAVLAEGLAFARACGIDPKLALEILKAGPAYSRAMDTKGDRMLEENFEPEARLSQHLKDVRLILAEGERAGARLPLSEVHRKLLEEAEAAGLGPADNSAIIKLFQKEFCR
jgi:3-hydroxyisobutyrate dehydrogenase-like beta-hydroxyacid dehydrogenase